jgi:hypothetical protein
MAQNLIFLPMAALAFWTIAVLSLVPLSRYRAGFAGKVTDKDFKFGESQRVPGEVSIPNRNYMNLLEFPLLFYVVCLMFYVTDWVDTPALWLAWGFVAFRIAHSLIHLTYNKPRHRLVPFALASLAVLALWVLFLVRIYA